MTDDRTAEPPARAALEQASLARLTCLIRHWTWADEALARFDRELAEGWEEDADPAADRPFGAYYHWCALLCSLSESALDREVLADAQFAALRPDLEATLPALQACRQLLVAIPASPEKHPHIVELAREDGGLGRLRRLHDAIGEALREEHLTREFDTLDPDR